MNLSLLFLLITILLTITLLLKAAKKRKQKLQAQLYLSEQENDEVGEWGDCVIGKAKKSSNKDKSQQQSYKNSQSADAFIDGIIAFFIMAQQDAAFPGDELLHCLLDCGFEYSEHGVFNYWKNIAGKKVLLFSLASATESGTFDKHAMCDTTCKGLCLFMKVNEHGEIAFTNLLQIMQQLSVNINGVILDCYRQPCTQDYLRECREAIVQTREKQREFV